jgi:hypothetical protein
MTELVGEPRTSAHLCYSPPMTDAPQTPAEKMKAILAAKQGGAARAGQGSGAAGGKQGEALAAARSFSKSKPALRK